MIKKSSKIVPVFFIMPTLVLLLLIGCQKSSDLNATSTDDTLATIPRVKHRKEIKWEENLTPEKHSELKELASSYKRNSVQIRHLPQKQEYLRISYPRTVLKDSLWGLPFAEKKSASYTAPTGKVVEHKFMHFSPQLLNKISLFLSNNWIAVGLSNLVELDYPTMTHLHDTRLYLAANPSVYQTFRTELLSSRNCQIHQIEIPSGVDPYAIAFWIRRDIDGSAHSIESILEALLNKSALWQIWRKRVTTPGQDNNRVTTVEFHPWYPNPMKVGSISKAVFDLPKEFHPWTLDTLYNELAPQKSIVRRNFSKRFLDSVATLLPEKQAITLSSLTYPLTLEEVVRQYMIMEYSIENFKKLYMTSLPTAILTSDESGEDAIRLLTKDTPVLQGTLFWIERYIDGSYDQLVDLITRLVPKRSGNTTNDNRMKTAFTTPLIQSAKRYTSDWCAEESTLFTSEMTQELAQSYLKELITTAQSKTEVVHAFGQYGLFTSLSDNPAFPQISPSIYYYYLGTRNNNARSQEPYFWEHVKPTLNGSFEKYTKPGGTLGLRMKVPFVKGSSGIDPLAVLISPVAREFDTPVPFQGGETEIITHTKKSDGTHIFTQRTVYTVPDRAHLTIIHDELIKDGGVNNLVPRHASKAQVSLVVKGDTITLTEDFEERDALGLRSHLIETPVFLGSLNPPKDTTILDSIASDSTGVIVAPEEPVTISFLISSTHKKELVSVSTFGATKILLETILDECE